MKSYSFHATIEIIGINPYVQVSRSPRFAIGVNMMNMSFLSKKGLLKIP